MGLERRLECRILPKGVLNMKYCPYCGAELSDGAASFCMECGKSLPAMDGDRKNSKEESISLQKRTEKKQKKPRKRSEKRRKKADGEFFESSGSPRDDGYDGYYDDVLPSDAGKLKEGVDMELVKKISAVAGVMLLIIVLCVVAMYLL